MSIKDRFKGAWSALTASNMQRYVNDNLGMSGYTPYYSGRQRSINRASITSPVFNKIALDASMVQIRHVKQTENGNQADMSSELLNRLTFEANIDQTGRAFIQDIVYSLMDDGVVAIFPVDTDVDPASVSVGAYNIRSWRTGRIVQWYPRAVRIEVYNDRTGQIEQLTVPKDIVGIVENPLYSVVNSPNSTLNRLSRKLAQLDWIDEDLASGKMNLILQLPYVIKSEAKKQEALRRVKEFEDQISKGRFGIAYTDGTEKITQLNRSLDNNIMDEVNALQKEFMNQIGLTENVFNGTAGEAEMLAYYSRAVDPILKSVIDEINRKFISQTARTQGQLITFYRDPFDLVPVEQRAQIANTLITARISTSNELRPKFGLGPSTDPAADKLLNPNVDSLKDNTGTPAKADEPQPETDDADVDNTGR